MQKSLARLRHSLTGLTVSYVQSTYYVQSTMLGVGVNRNVSSSNWKGVMITVLKAESQKAQSMEGKC